MLRVATRAKMIRPKATIQVTTMELVMGKPNGRAISTACCDSRCSSFAGPAPNKGPAPVSVNVATRSSHLWITTLMRSGELRHDATASLGPECPQLRRCYRTPADVVLSAHCQRRRPRDDSDQAATRVLREGGLRAAAE